MSEAVITLSDIHKSYGKHEVLKGVSMTVNKGDIYGLIGKNGAGKTTLFKVILGLSEFQSGNLSIQGAETQDQNRHNRHHIGFFVGSTFFGYLSGRANLDYFRQIKGIKDKKEVDRVLDIVGLDNRAAITPAKRYSMGMKQRLGIANALLGDPEILIFDEPTNGLDPQGIADVRNLITKINEEYGKTIVVSSHILGELEHTAHRFGIVHEGVLMKETSQEEMLVKGGIAGIEVAEDDLERAEQLLRDGGIAIKGVRRESTSLEDFYFGLVGGNAEGGAK